MWVIQTDPNAVDEAELSQSYLFIGENNYSDILRIC